MQQKAAQKIRKLIGSRIWGVAVKTQIRIALDCAILHRWVVGTVMGSMQSISEFIEKWKKSGGSERANYQMFLSELTEVLELDKPLPVTDTEENDHYRFERAVKSGVAGGGSSKFIDLYKRGSFILETKQGTQQRSGEADQLTLPNVPPTKRIGHGVRGTRAWDKMMDRARGQADNYARLIAREDGWPPFLITCDVGYVFEIYSDFSGQGHGYTQFPDGNSFRVFLDDLTDPKVQAMLRAIWNDPQSLDPSKTAARVTREIADQLVLLGKSFEKAGHKPDEVAAIPRFSLLHSVKSTTCVGYKVRLTVRGLQERHLYSRTYFKLTRSAALAVV